MDIDSVTEAIREGIEKGIDAGIDKNPKFQELMGGLDTARAAFAETMVERETARADAERLAKAGHRQLLAVQGDRDNPDDMKEIELAFGDMHVALAAHKERQPGSCHG